ncbi:MAG: tetratricopeptide repeat protein [Candidatus Melainabacteria bacterium]|nr:tetratricopeptide repeat protein [Candidatus Melainabacteria bacterium]MBX9674760.1 tetratricopeptide repeat protein [Candidatus Obscuribacterales bacterium]
MSQSDLNKSQEKSTPPRKVCLSCAKEYPNDVLICPDDDTLLTPILNDNFIGTTLADKYQILEKLGAGGMGLVYKAKHLFMKRNVAIKLMLPQYASSATALKRFRQEAQAASHLNHPNILTVYDFGVTPDGLPYLVMDLLEGTNLSAELEAYGHLPVGRSLNIFIQTCSALQHAHSKDVVHRDLKPGNIMLVEYEGEHDVVKIVDFGMAKILSAMDGEKEELTKTGEVFGSPMYMSPEQCMGKDLDARSDIYSLGCVMYRTLTGVPAVIGQTAMECFNKHATQMPLSFADVAPDLHLPQSLETIIFKALAKEPDERYASMSDLKDALLTEIVSSQDISATLPAGTIRAYTLDLHKSQDRQEALAQTGGTRHDTSLTMRVVNNPPAEASGPNAISTGNTINMPGANPNVTESQYVPSPVVQRKGMLWAGIIGGVLIATAAGLSLMQPRAAQKDAQETTQPAAADAQRSYEDLIKIGQQAYLHGDYKSARTKFNDALIKAKDKGDYEQGVPEATLWLGKVALEVENFDEAEEKYQDVVQMSENGKRFSSAVSSEALNDLGELYLAKRQFAQSKTFFDKALSIRQKYTGPAHAKVAETLAGLGNLALSQGSFKKANDLLKQAADIADSKSNNGLDDIDKAKIYNALGQTYQYNGQIDKARQYYMRALSIREKNLNPENPAIADTLTCLGTLEFRTRNTAKSQEYLDRALDIQLKSLGDDNASVANTKFCLAVLCQQTRRKDQAIKYCEDAYKIRLKAFGPNDPQTQDTKTFLAQLKK